MGLNDQFNECLDDLGDIGPYQVYCFPCYSKYNFRQAIGYSVQKMFVICLR